jgi:hypothetical protein
MCDSLAGTLRDRPPNDWHDLVKETKGERNRLAAIALSSRNW